MDRLENRCLGCGKPLSKNTGFVVEGKQYIDGLPTEPVVCNFLCLVQWDATGEGLQGNQGFNLAEVKLNPRKS